MTTIQAKINPDLVPEPINATKIADKNKKLSKKEARVIDNQLKENYGAESGKEEHKKAHDGPKIKDDYEAFEKRPYDRHSGTGRPAFKKNNFKKGGHGKGNVGILGNMKQFNKEELEFEEEPEDINVANNLESTQVKPQENDLSVNVVSKETELNKNIKKKAIIPENSKNNNFNTDVKKIATNATNLEYTEPEFPPLE